MKRLFILAMRWWSDRPLRIKGLIVIAVPIVVLLGTLISSYLMGIQVNRAQENVQRTIQIQRDIQKVHTLLAEAATGVRGYLLTGHKNFLVPYHISETELPKTVQRLRAQIRDGQQLALLNELASMAVKKSEGLVELIKIGPASPPEKLTQALVQNKKVLDDLRAHIDTMLIREEYLRQESVRQANQVHNLTMMVTVGAGIAGVLGALLTSLLFSAGIVRRVQQLTGNAGRLEHGMTLVPVAAANDELGQLSDRMMRASQLLAARAEEVQKARQEAERANQSKTEFLSRTSHELRTPLNAILGFAQLLQLDMHAPDAQQSLRHILKGGHHLLTLIDEVLDIARIETGHLELVLQPVEAGGLLREALSLIAPLAQARNIILTGPEKAADIYLLADRKRLLQVLLNLLSNAVKYNRDNGTVTLRVQATATQVQLLVIDSGTGIAPDMQKRLFTPFDRLGAEHKPVEGNGLGLVVSRQLTLAMGGEIGMTSVEGQGSHFWVNLPVAQATLSAEGIRPATAELATLHRPCSILYIEDNSSNLVLIEILLARSKHVQLFSAKNGADGLQIAQQQGPDLILLDLQLPDMSGEDVLQQLRASPDMKDIPIVILSADALATTIERLRANGASDYLTKPLDVTLFFSTLNRLLP
ncbi:response regulator [Undibacterium sp. CY18W]|uniref:histidine kinase n=1 Tax=Undibacterium hunanense TaxID=2762292 RepID=A0ABR6ZL35_9BURK|nr:ATP-binding protein [Undibacterium hunanense]MBC3916610.1 response regulator [Undibacterium hunanense]